LQPTEAIKAVFANPFNLAFVVTLAEHQLSTDLYVENTSDSASLEFQALFHNYIASPSDKVLISPLKGLGYLDKTEVSLESKNQLKQEVRDGVDVRNFTDFVYQDGPGNYKVVWPGGGVEIKTKNLKDVVIWNPRETGKSMGDMEDGGWQVFATSLPER
jgi:glucose-6-phosphate 1-epimerase